MRVLIFEVLTHRFGLLLPKRNYALLFAVGDGTDQAGSLKDPKPSRAPGRTLQPACATCWNSQLKMMKSVHTVSLLSTNEMSSSYQSMQELCKVLDSFKKPPQ